MKETVPEELLLISYPLVGTSSSASVEPVLKVTHPAPPALSVSQYPIALFPEFVARLSSIIAKKPFVRKALKIFQKNFIKNP